MKYILYMLIAVLRRSNSVDNNCDSRRDARRNFFSKSKYSDKDSDGNANILDIGDSTFNTVCDNPKVAAVSNEFGQSIRFTIISTCDRQTDKQTDT